MHKYIDRLSDHFFIALLAVAVLFAFANSYKNSYIGKNINIPRAGIIIVDQNSTQERENGSFLYPFRKISSAISLASSNPDLKNILISEGLYREVLEAPKNINLLGNSDGVIIGNPDNGTKRTVKLRGNNTLYNLKIIGGRYGIWIGSDAKATIINSSALSASWYGMYSEISKEARKENGIKIIKSRIAYNGRQGLYLQKGFFEISNSIIENNGEEGIDLHFGMISDIKNNIIRGNGEGGIETEIENNTVNIENNIIEKNGASGINLQTGLSEGIAIIKSNVIQGNTDFGIRCAIHKKVAFPFFKKILTKENNVLSDNGEGAIAKECNW